MAQTCGGFWSITVLHHMLAYRAMAFLVMMFTTITARD